MTWSVIGGVALMAFVLGLLLRGRRGRSPVEDYQELQQRAALGAELAEKAGTMDEVRMLVERAQKISAIKAFRRRPIVACEKRKMPSSR